MTACGWPVIASMQCCLIVVGTLSPSMPVRDTSGRDLITSPRQDRSVVPEALVVRSLSYPQEQLAPVHPEQDQPEDQEHGRAMQ